MDWVEWGVVGREVFSDVEARSGGLVEDAMAARTGGCWIILEVQWRWSRSGPRELDCELCEYMYVSADQVSRDDFARRSAAGHCGLTRREVSLLKCWSAHRGRTWAVLAHLD